MTTSARTVETNFADALAQLLYMLGDSDNLQTRVTDFENALPSSIIDVTAYPSNVTVYPSADSGSRALIAVRFEDGSVLHLTVTQIKEPNQ